MNRSRLPQLVLATAAVSALAAGPALAQTDPYSEAGATAVEVDGIAAVSKTSASTQGEGSADATVLELGGEQVVGGSQEGPGEDTGEILTTGENEQGSLTVGGHDATVEEGRSYARSAVVDANLGGEGGASATVLESRSTATEDRADAETTGVIIDLGGGALRLEVLHADTSSTGDGGAYVLSINGERILSSEQADGRCEIPADPLLHVLCLYAGAVEGGEGAEGLTGANAGVLDVAALDGNLTGRSFDATALSTPADGETATAVPAGDQAPAPAPAGDDAAAAPGELPRTGAGLIPGLLGVLAMGAGEGLRRFGKR